MPLKIDKVIAFIAFAFVSCVSATSVAADGSPPAAAGYKARLEQLSQQDKTAEEFALAQEGAAAGDKDAQFKLGEMYNLALGHPRDTQKALFWYRKAAVQGLAVAQNALGYAYDRSPFLPADMAESLKWYRKSAAQNDPEGLFSLGLAYDNGVGVEKNYAQAVALLRRSAMQGYRGAADYLEHSMASGPSIPAKPNAGQVVSCRTSCVNSSCSRVYDDGRRVQFQATQKFNSLTSTWEWDPGTC